MTINVATCARISTDNLGQDVDDQLHEVRAYCERVECEVVEECGDEGFAQSTLNRPTLVKIIMDARQRKLNLIVTDELSWCTGTPALLLNLLEGLKLWNVNLVSVKKGIDTSTPMGEMVSAMLSAINRWNFLTLVRV